MASQQYASSAASFKNFVAELGLEGLQVLFESKGWATFNDLAYSTPDPAQRVADFEEKVIPALITITDPESAKKIPRLRQLHAKAYTVATAALAEPPQTTEAKVAMPVAERQERTKLLKAKLTGFDVIGQNAPSTTLVDKMATIMSKAHVLYVGWEKCTSREQEMVQEVEIKALRLSPEGFLLQDVAPEASTEITGELQFDFALRRRALAADIAGLCGFKSMDSWHEVLKAHLMKEPPSGWRRVSWKQLRDADVALWRYISVQCDDGGPTKKTEENITAFEAALKKGVYDPEVRLHLMFLQGSSSAGASGSGGGGAPAKGNGAPTKSETNKLRNRIDELQKQMSSIKRKAPDQPSAPGGGKAGGKAKSGGRGPKAWGNDPVTTPDGRRICFGYNLDGCREAGDGKSCSKGAHVCPVCVHSHPNDCNHPKSRCPRKA